MTRSLVVSVCLVACLVASGLAPGSATADPTPWTVDDLFGSPTPFALGHRGYGANLGEDHSRPIENSIQGFRRAFQDGIRVVELDLQQTADGQIVVFHDDYLADFTCVSALTYEELHELHPKARTFRKVLKSFKDMEGIYGGSDLASGGVIFAEIKVPIPFCDGANTSEQAQVSESALVAAVLADVRWAEMEDRVILNSGSPSILAHVALQAPEIARALSLNVLQLLPPEVVEQLLQMPVVQIPKNDFGLDWYNIGVIARLPAMPTFQHFVGISLATGSEAVSIDKLVLLQAGAAAPMIVAAVQGAGMKVVVWTVDVQAEWDFVAQAGADGITTNNIPMGLAGQAPLVLVAYDAGRAVRELGAAPVGGLDLALLSADSRNSARTGVRVEFTLPGHGAARLALYDIAGRRLASREVGALGAGRHEVALGQDLSPGVYIVSLRDASRHVRLKAVVTR